MHPRIVLGAGKVSFLGGVLIEGDSTVVHFLKVSFFVVPLQSVLLVRGEPTVLRVATVEPMATVATTSMATASAVPVGQAPSVQWVSRPFCWCVIFTG